MSDLTDYEKNQVLAKATHVGLFSAAPSDAGGGTEITGAGYARQTVTWTLTNDTAVSAADVVFTNAGADWPQVGWVGLFDASTAGHLTQWVPITAFTLGSQRTYTIPAGDLEVDFS
jgi:hypothetical protein